METVNITLAPYYYKFSDLNNFIYDLREVKGFYIMDSPNCSPVDMELENANDYTDYMIILCVGINHKEIEIYYKDKKARDKEYKKLSKIFLSKEE